MFDKMHLMKFVGKIPVNTSDQDVLLEKIYGFLRGTQLTRKQEDDEEH